MVLRDQYSTKQMQVTFEGWRAKPEQVRKINGTVQEQHKVICEFVRSSTSMNLASPV